MASHQLNLLEEFDEIIWLEAGQIKHLGSAKETLYLYRKSVMHER